MEAAFQDSIYYGHLVKGQLPSAMDYLKQFPDQAEKYRKYQEIFEQEHYPLLTGDAYLNGILLLYQRYYRDVFFLGVPPEQAAETLRLRFLEFFHTAAKTLDALEDTVISEAFTSRGYHFQGGRTGGYYGPYVWKHTEACTYDVELPGGIRKYTVNFLDGFLSKSWLDFISMGEVSTGGWTNGDGIINCIRGSYVLESENFTVSLLKHESQHAMDLEACPDMTSQDLEYRAKLVELIYSKERSLLEQFSQEADALDTHNGHAMAAYRIMDGFSRALGRDAVEPAMLPVQQIQSIAKELFERSGKEIFA